MGFSDVATQLLFFIAVIGLSAGVIYTFGVYLDQTRGAMTDKQQYLIGQLRTDLAIANIDNSSGHLHIYVKNVGKQQLKTSCISLFVDSAWVNLTSSTIVDPTTNADVTVWVPEGTIKIKPTSAELGSSSVHEAKVVTCNGVTETEYF